MLFFREQAITSEQHLDFGRYFGDLEIHPVTPKDQEHREILLIQHDEGNRGSQNTWHSDVTWRPEPSLGSILRAIDVPAVGGDTLFADMDGGVRRTARRRSGTPRRAERGPRLHARLRPSLRSPKRASRCSGSTRRWSTRSCGRIPRPARKGIYVNAAFTVRIKGLGDEESAALLKLLYRQAGIPEYQCRFRWRNDTLAFWDNRSTQHYAVSDYWPAVRVMERVTVVGDRPY